MVAFLVLLLVLCATPRKSLNLFVPSLIQPFEKGGIVDKISNLLYIVFIKNYVHKNNWKALCK